MDHPLKFRKEFRCLRKEHPVRILARTADQYKDIAERAAFGFMSQEHISASRQDPNGVFLAQAPVRLEFLFFRNLNSVLFYQYTITPRCSEAKQRQG
uniref:Uncharacterized protein n=1 Tax=Candidatus Kentrum sp. TC TaxID=2126339 RepID=A0A450YM81_9GAMM|nr:MAG: hypothetical protein BECKTC1821E_GA0114239_102028 [Candidatus Kentron sp. TC]